MKGYVSKHNIKAPRISEHVGLEPSQAPHFGFESSRTHMTHRDLEPAIQGCM